MKNIVTHLTALKKGLSREKGVLYVVCAQSAHTTYTHYFYPLKVFSVESYLETMRFLVAAKHDTRSGLGKVQTIVCSQGQTTQIR